MRTLLEVQKLKKYFKTPQGMLHAVDGVSFSINRGETLGVVGESGCGKSTLGRVIIRLLDATEGVVTFEGEDILRIRDLSALRRNMQIIFQDPFSSLNPRMTVGEILAEPLLIHRLCSGHAQRNKKVCELMDTVGLASRLVNSYPHELDGGRRQRLGIARALALNPQFIVCDEPVSALDVSIQAQILNLMQDLQEEKGFSYLFITHNLAVVKHISNNIMVMYLGVMTEMSESEDLFAHPWHPYTKALLSAIPEPSLTRTGTRMLLTGEISSPIEPKPGCRFAARCPFARENCFLSAPAFEALGPRHFVACHYAREINGI